jgi:hypothetical protein
VLARVHIPSLGGATEWLNSESLGPAELCGHVVLEAGAEAYSFTSPCPTRRGRAAYSSGEDATSRNASTTYGSNCNPEQSRNSWSTSKRGRARRYGRSSVIAT